MKSNKSMSLPIAIAAAIFSLIISLPSMAEGLSAEDYTEIQQLYAQYNWSIDSGDAEAYAATFTPDGTFNNFTGHDALVGFIQRWRESMNGAYRKHWNTNLHLTGYGKTAQGKVYLMLLDTSVRPPAIVTSATYSDSLVKTDQGWRFTKRQTAADAAPPAK